MIGERPSVDAWMAHMVRGYAERGTCGRRLAGAVGLDDRNRVIGMGMNGVPGGFPHCRYTEEGCPGRDDVSGNTENCLAIHAEANMIMNSLAPERIVKVYVSCSPCKACALLLCNLPALKEVCYWEEYADRRGILLLRRRQIRTTSLPRVADSS